MTDDKIEKNFKYIQKHDQIKNDYCKNNGIILIRLNNLKTVEKELTKYFQEYGILQNSIDFSINIKLSQYKYLPYTALSLYH